MNPTFPLLECRRTLCPRRSPAGIAHPNADILQIEKANFHERVPQVLKKFRLGSRISGQ